MFAACAAAIIAGLLLLCVILVSFYRGEIIAQKSKTLEEEAKRISDIYAGAYVPNWGIFNYNAVTQMRLNNELGIFKDYFDAYCFFTDSSYRIIDASIEIYEKVVDKELNTEDYREALEGKSIVLQGKLGGLLEQDSLTVCHPVVIYGRVRALVFVCMPMTEINDNTARIIVITIGCILGAALISIFLILPTIRRMSSRIKQISEASMVIAGGDFEKRLAADSKDELSRLALSFNDMAESLNDQENRRREFIANISHDLRSPLTSMQGFIEALLDGTAPPHKREHYLSIVLEESKRLSKLANDIMDISKIQNLELELDLSAFDINELIRGTVIAFDNSITAKNININIIFGEEESFVSADYEKIKRVLYNLFDNAVKFTGNCGNITIETICDNSDFISVSVKDTGVGIDPAEQKHIFERFYKADTSRGADKSGSGLGLSIVREFVKAHGGTVSLKSELSMGCEFVFSIKR